MHRHPKLFLFAVIFVLARSAVAANPDCPTATPETGFQDFTIDLSTGAPVGNNSPTLNERVRFVFTHRNPFLQYDIKIQSSPQGEPALTAFTSLFSLLSVLPQEKSAAAPPAGEKALARVTEAASQKAGNPCWAAVGLAKKKLDSARTNLAGLTRDAAALGTGLSNAKEKFSTAKTAFESRSANCERLQTIGSHLQQDVEHENLGSGLKTYQSSFDKLFSADASGSSPLVQLEESLAAAKSECSRQPPDQVALSNIELLQVVKATVLDPAREQFAKQRPTLESAVKAVDSQLAENKRILSDPANFISYRYAGPFDDRTKVDVSVGIKKPSDEKFPDKPDIAATLNFGGPPRFTLGVGIAVSRLPTPEYEASQSTSSITSGTATTTTVTRVVGLKDNSAQRITPMLVLNTRLSPHGYGILSGIHFSFGLSGKVDNQGTDVEYLTGLTFGLAENKAFVTLGGYNGRVQKLQQGFTVGSELPKEIAQPPVRKDRSWKPMIAISYKVR
jgi:hypothetical protein